MTKFLDEAGLKVLWERIKTDHTSLNDADIKSITSAIEVDKDDALKNTNSLHIKLTRNDATKVLDLKLPNATQDNSGIMPRGYMDNIDAALTKIDGIAEGANKTIVDSAFSTTSTNPIQNKIISTWKNTTEEGIHGALNLIAANKSKLDTIDEHANNYSHPTHTAAAEGLYKVTVDNLGHVSHTTAVTKEDITKLGISGSASTVDTAMSDTSTNAVQNKVINYAITNHKINNNNFDGIVDISDGRTKLLFYNGYDDAVHYNDDNSACYLISGLTDHEGKLIPKLYYSEDGEQLTSQLLRDIDVVALSETEVNDILNAPI